MARNTVSANAMLVWWGHGRVDLIDVSFAKYQDITTQNNTWEYHHILIEYVLDRIDYMNWLYELKKIIEVELKTIEEIWNRIK